MRRWTCSPTERRGATPAPCSATAIRSGTLERLAKDRGPSYAEAHIRVTSGEGAHGDVVESIVAALEAHLGDGSEEPRPGPSTSSGSGRSTPKLRSNLACRSPVHGLRLEPFEVALAIFALDPLRLAAGNAELHQRLTAHDDGAFVKLTLAHREVQPGELDHLQAVVERAP